MQKGGRKIKRSKSLYSRKRRNKTKSIVTIIIMIVVIGGLIFLGYSVGEPIANFFKNKAQNQNTSSEPWSPSDVNSSSSDGKIDSDNSSSGKNGKSDESKSSFSAFILTAADLQNEASLTSAVNSAKQNGYTAVVVPLKSEGGAINYMSSVELANKAAPITSTLSSANIAEIIKKIGLISIARVDTLNDNLTPKADKTAGYTFEDSSSSWFDNKPENGGKPWLNPFSETTKTYFTDISAEICAAGFDQVICADVIFPTFRNSDLNYIGAIIKDPNRYNALINIVDIFKGNANNTNTKISVEVSANGAITGTDEVFKPNDLTGINVVVDYDSAKIGNKLVIGDKEIILSDLAMYDRVKTVFEGVKAKSGELEVIPCIYQEGMSSNDVSEAVRALTDLGYKNYIVK